jgi:hypothetical protein
MRGTAFFAVRKIRAASGGRVAKTLAFFTSKWVRDRQVDFVHDRGHVDFIREIGRESEEDSRGVDFRVTFHG